MNDEKHKMELAEQNIVLGRHRLYAGIVQSLLTLINLGVSITILMHLLGGR